MIDEFRKEPVLAFLTIASVAREHHHVSFKTLTYGALYRYRIGYTTIEHRHVVDINDGAYVWQAA